MTPDATPDRVLRQIAAALRTAERAGTAAEAENAMQVAQRLATRYSIDLAVARAASAPAHRARPTHRAFTLGEPRKRGLRTYVALFVAIAAANDVTCNVAHNSTYVVAFGFEDDLAVCEALYASLVVQMVRASDEFLARGTYRDDLVWRQAEYLDRLGRRRRRWEQAPVAGGTARINFHSAFAERVGERLAAAREQARAEAVAAEAAAGSQIMDRVGGPQPTPQAPAGASRTELVLVAKAAEVRDYYREHSTARGTWRGGRAVQASPDSLAAGRRAGSRARLGTEPAVGGSRRAIGDGP